MLLLLIIAALLIVDVLVFTQADKYGWSAVLLTVQLAVLWYFFPEVHDFISGQGWMHFFTITFPAYLGVGVAVAALKWVMFNFKVADQVRDMADKFKKDPKSEKNEFTQFLRFADKGGSGISNLLKHSDNGKIDVTTKEEMVHMLTPQAKKAVDRIAAWIWQWPVVVISLVLDDVILKIANWVSRIFNAIFTRFSKMLIRNATGSIGVSNDDPMMAPTGKE